MAGPDLSTITDNGLWAEVIRLRKELATVTNNGRGTVGQFECPVCHRVVTRLVKYLHENVKSGRVSTCSRRCTGVLAGVASGVARGKDPNKRHHLGGPKSVTIRVGPNQYIKLQYR